MHRGYVKLWRKSLDSCVMQNYELWRFWCWCLLKATHKPCKVMVGFQEVSLLPGQFVFGRRKAALALKMSEMTVRSCLKSLKSNQQVTSKVTSKYSIISIINWELYQSDDDRNNQQNDHQSNQQVTSKQPASNQQVTTNKNVKEQEECKRKNNGADAPFVLPDYIDEKIWVAYLDMRKRIKKPATEAAMMIAIRKLEAFKDAGLDPNQSLKNSIESSWAGVFEPRPQGSNGGRRIIDRPLQGDALVQKNRENLERACAMVDKMFDGVGGGNGTERN